MGFWDSYNSAFNAGQKTSQEIANRQAGNAFAAGDYGGAVNDLARSGNLNDARVLQDDRQRQVELARENGVKQQAATVSALGNGLKALRSIPDDPANPQGTAAARQQAFAAQIAPLWKQAGISDDIIQQTAAHPMDTQSIDVALQAIGQAAQKLRIENAGNGNIVAMDENTGRVVNSYQGPREPKYLTTGKDQVSTLIDPGTIGNAAPAASASAPAGPLDPHKFFTDFVLPHEGGLNPADANGAPSNFGINQTANPGVDVKTLTKDGAAQIFTDKYFKASGAGSLPAPLAAVQADTYFINPTRANQFLQQSGGDPQKYMDLREAWMNRLVQSDPARYGKYAKAWTSRNADLRQFAQQGGGAPQAQQGGPPTVIHGPASAPQDGDTPLTPEAVELMAGKYLSTNNIPALGGGKYAAANKIAILNAATRQAKALGLDANDLVAGTASVKALGQALNKATTMRSQVEGAEQTVNRNLDFALTLAPKGTGHGAPVWNRFEQKLRGQYFGDPDVTAFDNALHTVADEYAKVMTTNTGSGGGATSDSARQEAYRRLSSASTVPQLQANAAAMRTEMANRIASLREVEGGLRSNLRNGGRGGDAAPAQPARPAAPKVGEIQKGYLFNGGNPADPHSWSKVRQ